MSDSGGWTTPEGWGPPTPPPPAPAPGAPASAGAYSSPPPGAPSTYGYRPEVKPGVVPLRPLGLGELLDGAVGVLRRYPRPTLGLAAAVAVVTTLLNLLLLVTAFRPFIDVDATSLESGSLEGLEAAVGGAAVAGFVTGAVSLLASAILTGVLTAVVGRAVLGQPLELRDAWAQVRPRLLKLVAVAVVLAVLAGVIAFVGVFVGVLAIALGGATLAIVGIPLILAGLAGALYVYFRLSLAPCALVLERVGVRASLRRSWLLVKGDWWRVFGISLLTIVVALFVGAVLQVPFELLGYGSVADLAGGGDILSTRSLIASSLGSIVVATLVDPFSAGVRALLYVDRRMRAEGLDVTLTAAAATDRP